VLSPNRIIGVGQQKQEPSDKEVAKTAALWGPNPVHPSSAAYRVIVDSLESDIKNTNARYTNPTKPCLEPKKPRYDLSQDRAGWVSGCSAALPHGDSGPQRPSKAIQRFIRKGQGDNPPTSRTTFCLPWTLLRLPPARKPPWRQPEKIPVTQERAQLLIS
jgi:hypothetical protein